LILLHLVLLDVSEALCGLVLPLLVMVERLLNGGLVLFNASQSTADFLSLHLLFVIACTRERCTSKLNMGAS
jgi:hypothetical protein